MENYLNKKLKVGALFIDLSKAFDTLDHCLLLVKLSAYGFDNRFQADNKQISKM